MQRIYIKKLYVNLAIAARMLVIPRFCGRRGLLGSVMRGFLILPLFPFVAWAGTGLDESTVLALSPYDQNVVIELPDSDMRTLSVGQSLEGIDAVLIGLLEDRAVFEEIIVGANGTKVKETVWIYKAVNGVSRVQRLSRQAPTAPVHEVTRVISSESKTNSTTTK